MDPTIILLFAVAVVTLLISPGPSAAWQARLAERHVIVLP